MKTANKKEILPIGLIILCFLVGILMYPNLPDKMPVHWNIKGEIDGWASKNFAVFFFPIIILAIYVLMLLMPLIDPLKENYQKFKETYFWFRAILVVLFSLLYFYTLLASRGLELDIKLFIVPAFSIFFIFIGLFLPKIKKNYFVGIKTPWTFHSEVVWDKTHKFGGKLFIMAGILSFLGLPFSQYSFWIFICSVLGATIGATVYSYIVFTKLPIPPRGTVNKE